MTDTADVGATRCSSLYTSGATVSGRTASHQLFRLGLVFLRKATVGLRAPAREAHLLVRASAPEDNGARECRARRPAAGVWKHSRSAPSLAPDERKMKESRKMKGGLSADRAQQRDGEASSRRLGSVLRVLTLQLEAQNCLGH
ncbi:hypothetical protein AAFF_G00254190 [Aldrovandia affinis]|uniref:Uncharacterized protein n=1 Tax=Aldrovandia affinis TaxID=143900 RepID=A0AAD7RCH0_9TELE|nr:hypothetical protein AAFF_G00254190 [Aldrovandia affinis]